MRKTIFCLLVVLISTLSGNVAYAQFYDAEDEIYFYVEVSRNGKIEQTPQVVVLNFDGEKATAFGSGGWAVSCPSVSTVTKYLSSDINYYEKKVFNVKYLLQYRQDKSSYNWTVYNYRQSGSHDYYIHISADRNDMKLIILSHVNPTDVRIFKRVDKNYFLEKIDTRSRTNLKDEIIYE